ncbi:hypothetical protein BKA57DRAFT_467729 [Linnemannia elongata]|nr:hypothetical protein BKA57DRAFT_467729 [Linnemannia elongata]
MQTANTATSSPPPPRSCCLSAPEQQDPLSTSSFAFMHSSSSCSLTRFSSFTSSSPSYLFSTQPSHPLTSDHNNKRKQSFHFGFCPNCKHPTPTIMAITEFPCISSHGSVDCPRQSQHQHYHHPASTQSTPPPKQEQQSSMLISLHLLLNPYAAFDFVSGPQQPAVGSFLQPCKGLLQIAFETEYHLLGSLPHAVAMTVATTSSPSVKTAHVVSPIEGPISIYNLAQSRRRFYLRFSFSPSPSPSPSSFPSHHPCTRLNKNNKRNKSMHAHSCTLDDERSRARRCLVDRLWLNPDAPQEQQLLWDYPSGDHRSMESMESMIEDVEDVKAVKDVEDVEEEEEEEGLYLKVAQETLETALDKTSFPRLRSGTDSRLSSSSIKTLDRASRTKGDPYPLCAHAAAAMSDVTPDRRTTHTAAVALYKHDDNDEWSVFGPGVPSLTSSPLPSVSSQPLFCHTCTATPTTALSPLPCASTTTATPSLSLPPLPFPSATLYLDVSLPSSSLLLFATTKLDANLRSLSPEQPNRSTTIDEASSPYPFCSPSLSPSFIPSPLTSTFLASASSSPTLSTAATTTTTNTTTTVAGGINLNDYKGSLDAPANSVTTLSSSIALNYPSFSTNFTTSSNTPILTPPPPPTEQLVTDPEQFPLRYHPSIPSSMGHFNPASSTPESLCWSSSASSAAMSNPSSSNPHRNFLNQNGERTGDCHHVSSRVAAGCDHDRSDSDSDSGVDLDLADRNGNPAIPHRHLQHQEQVDNSDMVSTDEMRLRGEIMARISPRATMMSRTLPNLREVPVWDEPVAHQIRRVQSAHMAELHRQWEDQQQQQRQAQAQVQEQQQQPLHQHQRYNSYPLMSRSVSMSRFVPVAMERAPLTPTHRSMTSLNTPVTAAEPQLRADEDMQLRTLVQGSNSLYLNYEGGILRPEEQWRRGEDDMVGR